jgi:hypothetical protein
MNQAITIPLKKKQLCFNYNYYILLLFVIIEVLFFGNEGVANTIVFLFIYVLLFGVYLANNKLGIMYYFSFTLLTFGAGNYETLSLDPQNFWGLRFLGFSASILFSVFIFTHQLIFKANGDFKKLVLQFKFYSLFYLYSLLIGIFYTIISINYFDNFLLDFLTYTPIIIYGVLIQKLDDDSIKKIVKWCLSLTVISLVLSTALNKKFFYGVDDFLPSNAIYFILPFALILLRELFSFKIWILLMGSIIATFIFGLYFISGKTIMTVLLLISVYLYSNKYSAIIFTLALLIIIPNVDSVLGFFIAFYPEGVIRGKFIQIQQAVDSLNIHTIALIPSSLGNILAEFLTITTYYFQNIQYFFFGKGLGGAVVDVYGYLNPWTEKSGYASHDAVRNNFYKMHLAIFEVFVKAGVFWIFSYLFILIKGFFLKNKYDIVHSILFFAVFYVTKETLLLTLLIFKIKNTK